jgi:hypothetical protein
MKRTSVFPNNQMNHFELLQTLEANLQNRVDDTYRQIEDLKREIRSLECSLEVERDELETCQNEMKLFNGDTKAIDAKTFGDEFYCIEWIRETVSGLVYWTLRYYGDQKFSYGYVSGGTFYICPTDCETHEEVIKAIEARETFLANGDSVMF